MSVQSLGRIGYWKYAIFVIEWPLGHVWISKYIWNHHFLLVICGIIEWLTIAKYAIFELFSYAHQILLNFSPKRTDMAKKLDDDFRSKKSVLTVF